ncbi:MAG TPA: FKBP-type peptidyl-prolyl cis-trans isomerase [Solirubrobacterales bacterium]
MKLSLLIGALCLALVIGVSGCGGGDGTSSETQGSGSSTSEAATTADGAANAEGQSDDAEGQSEAADKESGKPDDTPSELAIGDYEAEGPFSAVSGQGGNKKPRFTPSGQPPPKKIVTRDLEVGTGPAAKRGDEVSVYFAGAIFETGEVELFGWPPSAPSVLEIGEGIYGGEWEETIEGMKVGGIRQVILPSSEFAQGKPVDYVIVMTDLQQKSGT